MNKETIKELRVYYQIPDTISDDDIERVCAGSLREALINLRFAINKLSLSFRNTENPMKTLITAIKKLNHRKP